MRKSMKVIKTQVRKRINVEVLGGLKTAIGTKTK